MAQPCVQTFVGDSQASAFQHSLYFPPRPASASTTDASRGEVDEEAQRAALSQLASLRAQVSAAWEQSCQLMKRSTMCDVMQNPAYGGLSRPGVAGMPPPKSQFDAGSETQYTPSANVQDPQTTADDNDSVSDDTSVSEVVPVSDLEARFRQSWGRHHQRKSQEQPAPAPTVQPVAAPGRLAVSQPVAAPFMGSVGQLSPRPSMRVRIQL